MLHLSAMIKTASPHTSLSVNDFIIKALALALRDVPDGQCLLDRLLPWLLHKHSDVGVAVAIPDGLITPIVRQAEVEAVVGDFRRGERHGAAARSRQELLKPEEYQGGTTAVSNLGMFGVDNFSIDYQSTTCFDSCPSAPV